MIILFKRQFLLRRSFRSDTYRFFFLSKTRTSRSEAEPLNEDVIACNSTIEGRDVIKSGLICFVTTG